MSKTKPIGVSFHEKMLEKIDKLRSKIPTSVLIRALIEKALERRRLLRLSEPEV